MISSISLFSECILINQWNTRPIPGKKPVHFKLGPAWPAKSVSSRSVQAYAPADHSLSWFELLATQGSCLAVFMALMRLDLLSIKADEAMIPPQKPVHPQKTLYISSPAKKWRRCDFPGPCAGVRACRTSGELFAAACLLCEAFLGVFRGGVSRDALHQVQ